MEQQIASVDANTPYKQLKERVQHFRDDASEALNAAKHDYEQVKRIMRNLQAKSELRAFMQAKLNGTTAVKPKAVAKPAVKKTASAKSPK